jgi:hypothetical protein
MKSRPATFAIRVIPMTGRNGSTRRRVFSGTIRRCVPRKKVAAPATRITGGWQGHTQTGSPQSGHTSRVEGRGRGSPATILTGRARTKEKGG